MRYSLTFGLATYIAFAPSSFADEWTKANAGHGEYIRDRTDCVHETETLAFVGEEMQKAIADCLNDKGWQNGKSSVSTGPYCYEAEKIRACKGGGTLELYKVDRAYCWDHVLATVGNTYSKPGWRGIGGLIDSHVTANENKKNLEKTQLAAMKMCLEGRIWAVEWKGEAAKAISGK
jgi:hypothetical protein